MAIHSHNTPSGVNEPCLPVSTAPGMREPIFTVDNPPPFDQWTDRYAMRCDGACMEPEIPDGASVIFDKSLEPRQGDFVGIWARQHGGQIKAFVKRLSYGIMPGLRYPVKVSADANIVPIILFEQINPPRQYEAKATTIYGVHRAIGFSVRDPGVRVGTTISLTREAVHWFDKPQLARKSRKRRVAA